MATTAVSNVARPCLRLSNLQSHKNANPNVFSPHFSSSYLSFKNNVALCKSHITLLKAADNRCSRSAARAMIAVGEKVPAPTLTFVDKDGELGQITLSELTAGKKVTLVAIPSNFTATFVSLHLPNCEEYTEKLRSRGVEVAIVAINGGWGIKHNDKLMLLNDGKAEFAKAMEFPPDFISGEFTRPGNFGANFSDRLLQGYALPYSIQVYVEDGVVQGFEFDRLYKDLESKKDDEESEE